MIITKKAKRLSFAGILFFYSAGVTASHLSTNDDEESPNPNQVRIVKIIYAGSGCPAGTVSELLAPDAKAFTLLFDSYLAEAGPGIALSKSRANCQIAVDLRFPQGYSFSLFDVDYRGYANLERGTTGLQKTTYYFAGQSQAPSLQSLFRGPYDNDYHVRDTLALSAVAWSPCGMTRALNLNTQVRVAAPRGRQAAMTLDSVDGQLTHIYGIRWRRCR